MLRAAFNVMVARKQLYLDKTSLSFILHRTVKPSSVLWSFYLTVIHCLATMQYWIATTRGQITRLQAFVYSLIAPVSFILLTAIECGSWTFSVWAARLPGRWWCHRSVSSGPPGPRWPSSDQELHRVTRRSDPQISWSAGPGKCRTASARLETWELQGQRLTDETNGNISDL